MRKTFFTSQPGFSLVEIIVVLGLFSSISTLVLGSLFNAQAVNARLQETQSILDNVNLSTQIITRDIRFGSDFYCATTLPSVIPLVRKNCPLGGTGGTILIFKPSDAANVLDRVVYSISNGILYKNEYRAGSLEVLQMTANDVVIESMTYYVDGANTSNGSNDEGGLSDYKQPLITLLISGRSISASSARTPVTFNIQTSVSARELDNQ